MALSYQSIAERLEELEKITSKIEKTQIIINMLKEISNEEEYLILFLLGRIFPEYKTKELGVNQNLLIKSLSKAYGYQEKEIEELWKKKGDIGKVAEEISKKKRQICLLTNTISLKEIITTLQQVSNLQGEGSIDKKISLIAGLFMKVKGKEAKYLSRFILGDMRIGVAEGIIRDTILGAYFSQFYWVSLFNTQTAGITQDIIIKYWKDKSFLIAEEIKHNPVIALIKKIAKHIEFKKEKEILAMSSFHFSVCNADIVILASGESGSLLREKYIKLVDEAHALINDFTEIVRISKNKGEEGLKNVKPIFFRPIKVMLAQRVKNISEAWKVVGRPAAFEYKFDGFRVQIHKYNNRIEIFTRRLENVTNQFPDIVNYAKQNIKSKNCIIEGEAIGYDPQTKKWLPFQKVSQRIRRKYNIQEVMKKIPVMVHLFDIIFLEDKKTTSLPFKERRKLLKEIIEEKEYAMVLAKQIITDENEEAERFYREALEKGNEGIMAKNLNAPYEPGLRVGNMLKIKPTLETLDLVIVGAEWGEGKRSGYLSSFELACLDPDTGEFLTIGKMGTGIKEKEESGGVSFEQLTEMLKPHIEKEEGREVIIKPKVVVEVAYEEIQKSPHYSSGFALRFPRLVRIREDKSPEETDTIERVERIYKFQRNRMPIE